MKRLLLSAFAPRRFLRLGALVFALAFTGVTAPRDASAEVRFHGEAGGTFTIAVTSWRDIPFRSVVRQQYDYSCGSAALATLLRYHYGVHVGEAAIFQSMFSVGDQARIRQVGFSMLDMKHYLETQGFAADGLRISLDRLAALHRPAVALITRNGYRHFVVVKGIRDGRILVGDPTFGLQTYSQAEFERLWNGVVLAIRHAPASASAPIFDSDEEWRPWAVAPLDTAEGAVSPSELLRQMPEIYQLREVRVIP